MRPFVYFLVGAVVGGAVAAFVGPHAIHWYAQPPFPMGCDCGPAMTWAMGKLAIVEVVGAVAGAIGCLALAFVFGARRGKQFAAPPTGG